MGDNNYTEAEIAEFNQLLAEELTENNNAATNGETRGNQAALNSPWAEELAFMTDNARLRLREIRQVQETVRFDRQDLPWMRRDQKPVEVNLALVTTQSGRSFYLGSAIVGDDLTRAFANLSRRRAQLRVASQIFLCTVQRLLELGYTDHRIEYAKTEDPGLVTDAAKRRPIWYASNGRGGTRVYFVRTKMERLDESGQKVKSDVIIRIAACQDKGDENRLVGPTIATKW